MHVRASLRAPFLAVFLAAFTPACGQAVTEKCDVEPPGPEDSGFFSVDQSPPGSAVDPSKQFTHLLALFRRDFVPPCVDVHREGDCRFSYCNSAWEDLGTSFNAGTVSVTGGLVDFSMTPEQSGYVGDYFYSQDTAMFEPGDELQFSITGSDDIEPLSTTLAAPPLPVITSGPPHIDRSQPSVFEWTSAPGEGRLLVDIANFPESTATPEAISPGPIGERVICEVDVADGTVTVPVSLLELLTPGAVMDASVQISAWNEDIRERDAFRLRIAAGGLATIPKGGAYDYSVKIH